MPSPVLNAAFSQLPTFRPISKSCYRNLMKNFARLPAKTLKRFCFSLDGLNFDVRRVEQEDVYRFLVKATIGYIPFSIESDERREAIKTVIIASRRLPRVRFGLIRQARYRRAHVRRAAYCLAGFYFLSADLLCRSTAFHQFDRKISVRARANARAKRGRRCR